LTKQSQTFYLISSDITSSFAFNSSTNSAFATTGHTVSLADVYSGPPGTSKPSKKKSRNTAGGQLIDNAQTWYIISIYIYNIFIPLVSLLLNVSAALFY